MNPQLQAMFGQMGGGRPRGGPAAEVPQHDTQETVYISALALLKMIKHCKAGVPAEVMGDIVGQTIDDYTIRVTDAYSFPQKGTTNSVEAVDEVYQQKI